MVIFLISLIIIALVIYLGVYLFKRHKAKQIEVYQAKVNEITENSLEKELAEISKLNLSGDSLTEFEKVDKDYREIVNRKLPEISELLNDLCELNQHYQFGRTNHELKDVDEKLSGTAAQFEKIKEELKNIRKVTEEHQKAVEELSEKYKTFGNASCQELFIWPSSDKLKNSLANWNNNSMIIRS